MTAILTQTQTHSPEEYLALEVKAETRHEYRDGEIVPIAGGTPTHSELAGALNALLWLSLRQKPYSVFIVNQRLWIRKANLYTYPDAMVVSHPIQLQAGRKDTVTQPIFIAEVLSKSTEGYDRGDKFAAYRTISTFREYLLIDQYRARIDRYVKQNENQWLLSSYNGTDATLRLFSLDVDLALADLYESVEFAPDAVEEEGDREGA